VSNIKSISIEGDCPFNTSEYPELNEMLGQLNAPTIGLKIYWGGESCCLPNTSGGKTMMYKFIVMGEEAASVQWIERFVRCVVNAGGKVETAKAFDMDNRCELPVKIPSQPDPDAYVREPRVIRNTK
jgi:hypothetical protein